MKKKKRWHVIRELFPKNEPIVGAEIGIFKGEMSVALLKKFPKLKLYAIDRWTEYSDEEIEGDRTAKMVWEKQQYWEEIKNSAIRNLDPYYKRVQIYSMSSEEACIALEELFPNEYIDFDFVFVDGDHSYEGCKKDIELWYPRVKEGGWLLGHDYKQGRHVGVKKAVDEIFPFVQLFYDSVWGVQK